MGGGYIKVLGTLSVLSATTSLLTLVKLKTTAPTAVQRWMEGTRMAELHNLLLAFLFLGILVIGSIAIMGTGAILFVLFEKIVKKMNRERKGI